MDHSNSNINGGDSTQMTSKLSLSKEEHSVSYDAPVIEESIKNVYSQEQTPGQKQEEIQEKEADTEKEAELPKKVNEVNEQNHEEQQSDDELIEDNDSDEEAQQIKRDFEPEINVEQQIDNGIDHQQISDSDDDALQSQSDSQSQINDDLVEDQYDKFLEEDNQSMIDDDEKKEEMEDIKQAEKPKNQSKLVLRDYQNILFKNSKNKNSIIYLPTGSGKTMVSIASMYYYLCREGEKKKIVFLANTIQLVKQQTESIKKNLAKIMENPDLARSLRGDNDERTGSVIWTREQIKNKVCCIHGEKNEEIGMTKRKKIESQLSAKKEILNIFKKGTIFVMITQMFLNSLRRGYLKLTDFSFIVLDECHHCSGDHPYSSIMKQFYFDRPKKNTDLSMYDNIEKLPIIMGLTASPVAQPFNNRQDLMKALQSLCTNLDSKFTFYETNKIKNDTFIKIVKIVQSEKKQLYPILLEHFQKFRDHKEAYDKIKFHFPPEYFSCVDEVINLLESQYEKELGLEANPRSITSVELLLFYDIKQCLLIKLRDIWLQLGEYAFFVAYQELLGQLHKINLKGEVNKNILIQIIEILKKYAKEFSMKYGKCDPQFFSAKVKKLIQILVKGDTDVSTESAINGDHSNDMVLVFAAKRRTVKYIEQILKNYRDIQSEQMKKNFECRGVTGYSAKSFSNYSKNQMIYQSDPSSQRLFAEIQLKYNDYLRQIEDENRLLDNKNKGQSEKLTNQMNKMKNVKCGKLLLEVEEKYSHQINKINDFRNKKFRVLITTSVTEEGFDIPECNIVISFDKPNSLKSYIQIKGRARKQNSKYFIFTDEKSYEQMNENRQNFDDTIKVTFDIALNRFSRKDNQDQGFQAFKKFDPDPGYRKSNIKQTGALLNTNYSLEILKTYCTSLRQPNKPMFYFIETPNIAFRCIVYFPRTSTTKKPFIVGDPQPSKVKALKSASYRAVIYLYKQGYIKSDLRPKKYEQLEDEREIERFEDLAQCNKNEVYRAIFEEDVRIDIENVEQQSIASKKFMRFYFRSVKSKELDFPEINPDFSKHIPKFKTEKYPFQIYMMKFSNKQNLKILSNNEQQIGLLTCFSKQHIKELFSEYLYSFEENEREGFHLKTVTEEYKINKAEYEKLKNIHLFLIASVQNREHEYYENLTQTPPAKPGWIGIIKKFREDIYEDKDRQFYPLLVLLTKKNDQYLVDEVCNKKIEVHQKLFSNLYLYHNISMKNQTIHKFEQDLSENIKDIKNQLKGTDKQDTIIVQSIEREFCFHKCLISQEVEYTEQIDKEKNKKQTLKSRHQKLQKMFKHPSKQIKSALKITLWRKYKKEKKAELFQRDVNLMIKTLQNPRLYLFDEFVLYPLNTSQLFKASLAVEFLFKAYHEYTLAFAFKNLQLAKIVRSKVDIAYDQKPFIWNSYPSIVLENQKDIFSHLNYNGNSNYLRSIGKNYNENSKFIKPEFQLSISKIRMDDSVLSKQNMSLNDTNLNNILDNLSYNNINPDESSLMIPDYNISDKFVSELKITEILKVLTSRMYKFSKYDNYEEYQFIGDVVLKLLSTIQVYLQSPEAQQSEMHIRRANIICNANLHRKAILKKVYKYILTKKYSRHPPPYEFFIKAEDKVEAFYEETKIKRIDKISHIEGFHYIPGKVHADVIEALIGAVYLKNRSLEECQFLLYSFDILKKPNLKILFNHQKFKTVSQLPKLYSDFQDRIDYKFKNKGLLIQALTHSSFKSVLHSVIDKNSINSILEATSNNLANQTSFLSDKDINERINTKVNSFETFYERLQFLGDAILDLIVVEYLYEKYGSQDEGLLTELKQAGVSNKTLGIIAMNYGMHELILMDHPQNDKVMKEFKQIQRNFKEIVSHPEKLIQMKINSIKILGDVFEALVGSIYLDLEMDYNKTKAIVFKLIIEFLEHYTDLQTIKNSNHFKCREYLEKNNYKNCHIKKDVDGGIQNGMFKFLLVDRMGNKVDECWETNEKRAYDIIYEKFYEKQKQKQ